MMSRRHFLKLCAFGGMAFTIPVRGSTWENSSGQWQKHFHFTCDDFLQAASQLQKFDIETRIKALRKLANSTPYENGGIPEDQSYATIILCRMLFAKKFLHEFRRPLIGSPQFIGGYKVPKHPDAVNAWVPSINAACALWNLEPITLVNDVPFLVVDGYLLAGHAESASHYLEYCLEHCDWSLVWYQQKSKAELNTAMQKLLASSNFKPPLTPPGKGGEKFLAEQIT